MVDSPPALQKPQVSNPHPSRWLNRSILGIGLASLFSDLSHEMATTILPLYVAQQIRSRPNFERPSLYAGVLRHQFDCVIQIPGLKDEDPAKLLFRLSIWAIHDRNLASLPAQGFRVLSTS